MPTERSSHRIAETGDVFCASEDEWVEAGAKQGWTALYNWGKDGWDIGGSYVTMSQRRREDGLWDTCTSVEGDLTIIEGVTAEARDAWLDQQACWHWLVGQSSGPVDDHVDAEGKRTEHQSWSTRVNLVKVALHEHIKTTDFAGTYPDRKPIGHMLYDLPMLEGDTLWSIHRALHAEKALRAGRALTDEELVDWMDPDWRGPFSWARCDADKETA